MHCQTLTSSQMQGHFQPKMQPYSGHLTVPRSPHFEVDRRSAFKRKPLESTEELQLKAAKEEHEREVKRRKMVETKVQQVSCIISQSHSKSGHFLADRSTAPLTVPEDFHFRTDERAQMKGTITDFSSLNNTKEVLVEE